MANTKGDAMKDLPDVEVPEDSWCEFAIYDISAHRLDVATEPSGNLILSTDSDYMLFPRDQAEQLVESLRRLLAGEPIKP